MIHGLDDDSMQFITAFREHEALILPAPMTDETITDIINEFCAFNYAHTRKQREYDIRKHNYEIHLLELKYSEKYEKYKAIKEKEERARIELAEEKEALIELEAQLHYLKANVEEQEKHMKMALRIHGREDNDR